MSREFGSNQEIYQFVLDLAKEARLRNQERIALALEESLQAGMTASEQLGEVRKVLTLVKPLFSGSEYQDDLREDIDVALNELDRAFKS